MTTHTLQVSDTDRLVFTVFLALVLHAMIVLGITFRPEDPRPSAQTLEITLAQFSEEEAPEKADFLAASHQQGSGTEQEKSDLASPLPVDMPATEVQDARPEQEEAAQPPRPEAATPRIETQAVQAESTPAVVERVEPAPRQDVRPSARQLLEASLEEVSLEAQRDEQLRAYAKRPRVTRVTAVSAMASADAAYVDSWRRHVERVGNLNYPAEARRAGVHGTLRLLVSIYANGSLKDVQVLESSGHSVLDDAAVNIVRLAAPFPPFPEQMREKQDILEIIRTWSFQPRGLSSG
ncbi:MAG: energy transducer TonB [Gammaproteobacteria bacterium]|nr:energy transducer TonB [Gammaproteobacteria bacterium]